MKSRVLALLAFAVLAAARTQAQTVSNFVNMTPCRLVDTRDPRYNNGGLGQPTLLAKSSRDFNLLASGCGIPQGATAYSLNITVVPRGPLPYLTIWPTGSPQPEVSTLNSYSGAVAANAAVVPAGKDGQVSVYVDGATDVLMDVNGYYTAYVAPVIPPSTTIQQITQQVTQQITQQVIQSVTLPEILAQSSSGFESLAIGNGSSSVGALNTAIGFDTLNSVGTGQANVAVGWKALRSNSQGGNNIALGASALTNNTSGSSNIAIGTNALLNNALVGGNVAVGHEAMFTNTNGQKNVALGFQSLFSTNIGSNNIALGNRAGYNVNTDDNIEIGNVGDATDARTIRIGTQGLQLKTFIAGISGVSIAGSVPVYVNNNGQLGIFGSSRRFKEDIIDLPSQDDRLAQLRPVQFRYKQPAPDGTKPLQYGLIAEEVESIYPELVVRDADGKPLTVAYQELPALLLQQLQQQAKTIADLESRLAALENKLTYKAFTGSSAGVR